MRIGIIIICKVNNYSIDIQVFEIVKALQLMGHVVEIIDYTYYKNYRYTDCKRLELVWGMDLKGKIVYWLKYRVVSRVLECWLPMVYATEKRRLRRYTCFHCLMPFTREYTSMEDLYNSPPLEDIYMVGSDQVWNPGSQSSIEPYFLTFVRNNKPKMSYASSFGVASIDRKLQSYYGEWLRNIDDTISVREDAGVGLVKSLSGKDAYYVLDPTLLLVSDEWLKYASYESCPSSTYILIYITCKSLSF